MLWEAGTCHGLPFPICAIGPCLLGLLEREDCVQEARDPLHGLYGKERASCGPSPGPLPHMSLNLWGSQLLAQKPCRS